MINVYPSQDTNNQTLWIFSGSSTARNNGSIRTSGSYHVQDSWEVVENNYKIYNANKPSAGLTLSLSSLFSSSNAKDIASVNARIPGGGKTNITFAASATNTPTFTIGSGSRTISQIYMRHYGGFVADDIGTRVSGSDLSYSSGNSSAWVGAGILNKPIGDFHAGTLNNRGSGNSGKPWFAAASNGSVRIIVNTQIIPEPEEYALIFGLFALAFVFFHRHRQRKRQQALDGKGNGV